MKSLMMVGLAAALAAGLLLCGSSAAEKAGEATTESTAKEVPSPLSVNFPAQFGLDFDSLKGLGVRIARAEDAADPVGLVLAAQELQLAEHLSGKKAPINSADLLAEGVEMGKRRHQPKELLALAHLVKDEKTKTELTELAARVAKMKGEKTRGISGNLIVRNTHFDTIHIYINDNPVGHVFAGGSRAFNVGDDPINDTTKLFAHDSAHTHNWGPHFVVTPNSGANHVWHVK
jgi:hypothetical protein